MAQDHQLDKTKLLENIERDGVPNDEGLDADDDVEDGEEEESEEEEEESSGTF
ncbi:MAG TPA: hypothetical protein VNJ02_14975 [Vicinamibacterales bacterium]|nr:hypothetical protein [Vicinamibacterales bacterium]